MSELKERVDAAAQALLLAAAMDAAGMGSESTVGVLAASHTDRMLNAARSAENGAPGRVALEAHWSYLALMSIAAGLLVRLEHHGDIPALVLNGIVEEID